MTNPAHMWSYWRDKKGVVEALEDYYPELMAKHPVLQMAVTQIKMAEASIEQTMKEIDDEEDELT